MPDVFELPNVLGNPKPPSRKLEQALDRIQKFNHEALIHNESRELQTKQIPNFNNLFLFCALCQGAVNRRKGAKKNKTVEVGNQTVTVANYKCTVCGVYYSGNLPHIKLDSNPELEWELLRYNPAQ